MQMYGQVLLAVLSLTAVFEGPVYAQDAGSNAALRYWQAFSALPQIGEKLDDKINLACREEGFDHKIDHQLVELISSSEYSLRMLHHGVSTRTCDWGTDLGVDGAETLLPHIAKTRQLARLALVRARRLFESHNDKEALDDVVAAMAIARHISHDNTMIGLLIGYSIDMTAMQVLAAYLPTIDSKLVNQAMNRRRSLIAMQPMPNVIASEASCIQWAIDELRAEGDGRMVKLCSTLATSKQQAEEILIAGGSRARFIDHLEALKPFYSEMQTILALPTAEFESRNKEFLGRLLANPVAEYIAPNLASFHKASTVYTCKIAMLDAAIDIHTQGPQRLASHQDPFGEGPFERTIDTKDGDASSIYRLKSQLERKSGKPVELAVGVAIR